MMNNSKAKQLDRNDPSKSKPPEKQSRTQKASKKKNANTDSQGSSSRKQGDATPSTAGHYINTLEQPLTRRPLRNTLNKNTVETIYAESNHIPLVIPKREKPDAQSKSFHIARDPRMTEKPIMERDDDTEEDVSNEAFPLDFTKDATGDVLQSTIDINVENVKSEIDDLGLEENNDWKARFLSEENTTTEEPITIPAVRIKSEPIDENDFNVTSDPIEDDRCSVDSGSTVGLPSPERASTPSSPSPSLETSENNQITSVISDENETSRISPDNQLISTEHKDGKKEEDPMSENELPTNSASMYYSTPTDLEEEYRKLEREKAAAAAVTTAASKQDYSRDSDAADVSSDDEMPMLTASHVTWSFNGDDDFGDDDDGEPFCDYDAEKDPSWATPESSEDFRAGQKRPLPIDEVADINGATNPSAKKSKFQVLKFPQDSTDSVIDQSNPVEEFACSSATLSTANSSNTETPQSSLEMDSEALPSQPVTSTDKDQSSTRTRLPVKLTTTNRASMMVEDFLNSVNINAARVPNKRAQTPTKTIPIRKKQLSGDSSTPTPPSQSTSVDISDNISGVRDIHENNTPIQQNLLALTSGIRDPRLGKRMANEASSSSMNQPPTPSSVIANLSRALRMKILIRILKLWQFKWIEQQYVLREPPPLLDEDKYYPLEIPQLSCVPVLTKYCDLHSYCDIFQPLMLHEMWSTLVLQNRKEKKGPNWKCSITSSKKEGNFVLLQCILLLEFETEALAVSDLVVLTFARCTGELIYPFGFVESSKMTKKFKIADLDPNLMPKNKSKVNYSAEIVIRIIRNYAPKNYAPGQKNIIASLAKVASLTAFMDLFHAQAALDISPLRDVILQPRPFAFQLTYNHPLFTIEYMDSVQTDAYYSIAQSMLIASNDEPKIAILQGFPGTGKTHVIVHIINHLAGHKFGDVRNKILYCAPTNAAVDEMTRRLLKYNRGVDSSARFDVLRMGSWARLHPDVKEATLDDKLARLRTRIKHENPARKELHILNEKLVHLKNLKESIIKELHQGSHSHHRSAELEDKLIEVSDEIKTATALLEDTKKVQEEEVEKVLQDQKRLIVCQADVICSTLEACCSTDMENIFLDRKRDSNGQIPRPFLCCIIDDASLCTEPQTLVPLTLGMKKLILAGDVELLPFTLNSTVAKESRLDQSLFSRFHSYLSIECSENERPFFSLDIQHRMNPEICQWTSKYYYGNRLLSSTALKFNSPLHAYRILDVRDSHEIPDGSNFVNQPEAEVILKILECMVHSPAMADRTIGIITFYNQQRIFIRSLIKERLPRDYTRTDVRLVQDLQGTEMDVVIISCVKTEVQDKDRNLAILTDHWNVAVTRAIESLFICGHLKTLQANEVLKDLISDADKRQVIHRVSSKFERSMLYDILLKPAEYTQL